MNRFKQRLGTIFTSFTIFYVFFYKFYSVKCGLSAGQVSYVKLLTHFLVLHRVKASVFFFSAAGHHSENNKDANEENIVKVRKKGK